jgi:hypothetical protein
VAVSSTGSGDRVMTSLDGISWTSRTSAADRAWWSVTYGDGRFVAVDVSSLGNRVMTSETSTLTFAGDTPQTIAGDLTGDRVHGREHTALPPYQRLHLQHHHPCGKWCLAP